MRAVVCLCLVLTLLSGGCGGSTSHDGAAAGAGAGGGGAAGTGATAGFGGRGGGGGVPLVPSDKVDLLLMIDNSTSMADKQDLLSQAVPQLIRRLTAPTDRVTGRPPLFAVKDLHIGVISSSLGGHGADQCSPSGAAWNPTMNDGAHLIGQVRELLKSHQNLGFLWWDPNGKAGGETDQAKLIASVKEHVMAAGETGCGYEAQLESWYRFLVDPAPPKAVVVENNVAKKQGIDDVLLAQRADFLRPDSVVIVIMLTDENDCSIVDGDWNWTSAQLMNPNGTSFHMARATSACATDPDSPCCRSCNAVEGAAPLGCGALSSDPECAKGPWNDPEDHPHLRCWDQKRRFGTSFLYPTERYLQALSELMICPSWTATGPTPGCQLVPNPLLTKRNAGLVFMAGIVGVPWQDLATEDTLGSGPELRYMDAAELAAKGRWAWFLPTDGKDQPDDPLMIESTTPRSGTHPATGVALAPPSAKVGAQPVNGHEWNTGGSELQYACIYRLSVPKDCTMSAGGCSCSEVSTGYSALDPLCQNPVDSTYSTLQNYAKAFPSTRLLHVLKGLGNRAAVGSICPKVTGGDPTSAHFGYNPVVDVLLKSVAPVLAE